MINFISLKPFRFIVVILTILFFHNFSFAQTDEKFPVVLDSDTLFFIHNGIGTFSTEKRAEEISSKLNSLLGNDRIICDSIKVVKLEEYSLLKLGDESIMAISKSDAQFADTTEIRLAEILREVIVTKLKTTKELYSRKAIINNSLYSILFFSLFIIFLWFSTKTFPWVYKKIKMFNSDELKTIRIKGKVIFKSSIINKLLLILSKGVRFVISLFALYLFLTKTLQLWPYTRKWDLQPVIEGIALLIFYTFLLIAIGKGAALFQRYLTMKCDSWNGTKIRSIKIKTIEVLSAERTVDFLKLLTKVVRFGLLIIIIYSYITIAFSLFSFSKTWANTLLGYVLTPLKLVVYTFLNFLPNLFFIIVIVFVFNYLIKAVKFFFMEIDKGTLEFPGFHRDWAVPTYKIVRFMIIALEVVVIFPYLPGSNSPAFQGVSVFLGILFSFGSGSAISNMVAGIVLTYMRPFKIGDRVKIADTMGDIMEKTLLITRIRTIKNVDITIPNSMVLGAHIVNYSSSDKGVGLILNTTVTIGYDSPWRQIHELLISAAFETKFILKEPKPFVLQTSLDDFYVSYEINAYTKESNKMAIIYSELHSKIQDKFNEAGVEIMSPHYGAMRDGNQTAIPPDYLPKEYKAPSFRIFGLDLFGNQNKTKD
ncbi:MAG: hypothetical protein AUJ54_08255 [Ignavibacteria bacterium CG1_02_37_35]|nr:MAG: hypothetical protein AUJ54_08255 [Ignavibacteria bacterium CG1_02_37_35]